MSQASTQKGNKDNNSKEEVVGIFEGDFILLSLSTATNPDDDHPEILKIKYLLKYNFKQMAKESKKQQKNYNKYFERSSVRFHSKEKIIDEIIGRYL